MSQTTSIKSSPNYEQQVDEVELLKNIIPEKIEIISEEPDFNIQIEIKGNTEKPKKTFILNIYLNYDYPEKCPTFKIEEINKNLSDKRQKIIKDKLNKYCEENIGFTVIYQLYEIVQEFSDEEEKLELLKEEEKDTIESPYLLTSLKKEKAINEKPREIILLKNNNVLIIDNENKFKIYDNKFESLQLEHINDFDTPFICCRYFPSSERYNPDFLYLFDGSKVYVYKILYYRKKTFEIESDNKLRGNNNIKLIDKFEEYVDVIELPKYKNSIFFLNNDKTNKLLYQYEIENMYTNKTSLKLKAKINVSNDTEPVFRKLYPVNSDKFILASYTLKFKDDDEYVIQGINELRFVNSNNFTIKRKYDIKISPFNHSVVNYKDNFLIISYFNTKDKDKNIKEENLYNFEDYNINKIFNIVHYKTQIQYDYYYNDDGSDYDYDEDYYNERNMFLEKNDMKFYSYDITEHLIGIFDVRTEELITIIEYDFVKIMCNIKNNLLFLFEKNLNTLKSNQFAIEAFYHYYFDNLDETPASLDYTRDKYLAFLSLDDGFKIIQENFNYDNITCILEVDEGYLAVGSLKKGLVLYSN